MREGRTVKIYFWWLLAFALFSRSADARELRFPLTNDMCPTSSFGSYRGGHLHGGMDFSTGGVTGVPVLAVDSCWVWRIRIWNGGYGKALYAQLPDGKIALYGHLSGFRPELEAVAEAEQDTKGAYEVEIHFDPGRFSFAPGDTLAFSGDTGSGPPHLHFELRSGPGDHSKINPVPEFLTLREDLTPEIKKIALIPLSPSSTLNERYEPLLLKRRDVGDTLRIAGAFGVSVNAVDHAQCGKVIMPIVYEAWVEGYPIWGLQLDRFPFSKSYFVSGLYDVLAGDKYVRFYDSYGLDLSGFATVKRDRFSNLWLAGGPHTLVLKVKDAWGNADSLTVPLVCGNPPYLSSFRLEKDGQGVEARLQTLPHDCDIEMEYRSCESEWKKMPIVRQDEAWVGTIRGPASGVEVLCTARASHGFERKAVLATGLDAVPADSLGIETVVHRDFLEIYARSPRPPESLPIAQIPGWEFPKVHTCQPVGPNLFRTAISPGETSPPDPVVQIGVSFDFGETTVEKSETMMVGCAKPGRSFVFPGEHFRVEVIASDECSAYSLVRMREDSGTVYRGFEAVEGRLVFEPHGVFLDSGLKFRVKPLKEQLSAKHGVYAQRGEWPVFLGRFDSTGTCEVNLRQLEDLVILEDLDPPEITSIGRFRRRPHDGKATFGARTTDTGSGVDAGTVRGYVDGDVAIVGIDPDTGRVTGRTRKPLQSGKLS